MKYQLIDEWKKKAKLVQLCTLFEVSRSSYYHYQSRQKCAAICMTSVQVKAAFSASGNVYGSRRLVSALKEQAIAIGRYKVRRIMRAAQLTPVWERKFVGACK